MTSHSAAIEVDDRVRPTADLLAELRTSADGLSAGDAATRLREHGPNTLTVAASGGLLRLFLRQFSSPLILILVAAAIVAAISHARTDAVIVLIVLLGSALLTTVQEHRATDALATLRDRIVHQATVLRDGSAVEIPSAEIVPGDVVLVSAGSLVPADGVVLESRDLYVDQSALTGEPLPVEKGATPGQPGTDRAARANHLLLGTSVRSGWGKMLVLETGRSTMYGSVAARLARRAPETGFERGIRQFGYLLTRIILLLVLLVFAANVFLAHPPIDSLLFAIALAVGISPELLPAIISVTLAKGARVMAAEGVIVRRLNAIENLGSMDVLCLDKTGTLTEGTIRLHAAVDGAGKESPEVLALAAINARLQSGLHNPFDEAIISSGAASPSLPPRLDEIPYDFERRRVTVVVGANGGARMITKGAAAQLLQVCGRLREQGAARPMTGPDRRGLETTIAGWSVRGFRTLAVASHEGETGKRYTRADEIDLVFEGLLLFADQPKEGIERVLGEMRDLGVRLKIITGDDRHVARHVADRVGLEPGTILTGEDLRGMSEVSLRHRVDEVSVFAEVDPSQKERILLALQRSGHVVGFMGDGINDGPALHAADVGISVDNATEVARESADLVLLRSDLEVLRRGIVMGRTTFANTLKYVRLTTSANFGNMLSMAVASLFLPFLPLLASQILLNNFLSDLPAMAIAGDRVDADWIERPRRWEIAPIRSFMVTFGLVSSLFDFLTFALLLLLFRAPAELFRTGWFVLSLLTELVVIFIVRTSGRGPRTSPSPTLTGISVLTAATAVALPFSPLAGVFRLVPLPPLILGALLLLTVGYATATSLTRRWYYSREGAAAARA